MYTSLKTSYAGPKNLDQPIKMGLSVEGNLPQPLYKVTMVVMASLSHYKVTYVILSCSGDYILHIGFKTSQCSTAEGHIPKLA